MDTQFQKKAKKHLQIQLYSKSSCDFDIYDV